MRLLRSRLAAKVAVPGVLLAVGLVAGCGVPERTDVQVDGPAAGAEPSGSGALRAPPGPDQAGSAEELVDDFLLAAAADPANAAEQLRTFIQADQREDWRPGPQVLVVRVPDDQPLLTPGGDGTRVRLDVRQVGTLSNGTVEPRARETRTFQFDVVTEVEAVTDETDLATEQTRYRIADPPDVILLSERALADQVGYLRPTSIYFWDSEQDVLVPDLRWVPTALPLAQRAQTKLEWLLAGPAPWLESLTPLPDGMELEGNVVSREDRLEITFSAAATDVASDHLDAQVWWTLREELRRSDSIGVTVNGQQRQVTATAQLAYQDDIPRSFVLLGAAVVPYAHADDTELPQEGLDSQVASAALTGRGDDAALALVRQEPDGGQRLIISTADGAAGTDLVRSTMSRPVWLSHPGRTGLVAADGRLHRFTADGTDTYGVPVPNINGRISSLAVAPDGRRVAMVADGAVYVASLVRREDGSVSVNPPRRLYTTATDLSGVAFIQENWLAVVGDDGGRKRLYEIALDGGYERVLPGGDLGAPDVVTNVVGYPGDPYGAASRGMIMFEADGRAYRYRYPTEWERIGVEELGIEVTDDPPDPRAPFFAE